MDSINALEVTINYEYLADLYVFHDGENTPDQ
jgi:hypothetical protein